MAPGVDTCSICEDNFIVNSRSATCNCCYLKFHGVCVGLKDSWLKSLSDCRNLHFFCDDCNFKWQETAILKTQLQSVTREKQLIEKLNTELQYSNELQKKVIKMYDENVFPKQAGSNAATSRITVPTYSEVINKEPTNQKPVLLIKSMDENVSNEEVIDEITKTVKPAEIKVCINNTRKIQSGIAIQCDNESSLATLRENLSNKLGNKYNVRQALKLNPRMLIKNVRLENLDTPEEIINNIINLNDLEDNRSEIKFITKLKHFENTNIVIEVSPSIRKLLLAKGSLYIGWKKCLVSDHLRVIRCVKCCAFGHLGEACNSELVCPKCTNSHKFKDCKSEVSQCINCTNHNKAFKRNLSTDHSSHYTDCPIFLNYISNLKARINYGN